MPSLTERIPPRALDTLTWRQLGPWRGGRATAVAGHPRTPDTFYFGASGGGVWRTDNAGATWRCLSDGQFARGSVGALAVAPSEPETLYVGMGECSLRGNVTGGDGVYVSHDGGTTWAHRGLTATQNIARIAVHPQDAERVWVAAFGHRFGPNTERGVYRSDDGGATWARILFRDAQTGAIDLALDPANPRILYAALWQACRTPWGFTSGGPGSGIFKSVDGGDTWTEITRRPGLPAGLLGRVGLSVSPANPRRVWALIEADGATGVYRSDDRGETWTWASDEPNLAVRPWYFGQIVADPRDADTVYVPHRKLWQSVDGGRSFRQMNTTYWDQHALWLDPDDPHRMILGNDGGAAVSRDSGTTWSTILNQPTAELYHVATDTRFPYRIYGAQQDTSTISLPIRSDRGPISQADWRDVGGGESGHIAVRPDNPEIVYAASYAGEITRYDHRTGDLRTISVWPEASDGWGARDVRHRFNWSTPVALSPHDPNTLYVAGERVFRSTDEGQSWEAISPGLTRADPATLAPAGGPITYDSSGADYYGTILTFAESPLSRGTLWAGSDDGLLHISRDNGATWADVTPPGLPQWANICTIEPSPHAAGTAYVAASNHKRDDFRPLLYKTSDGGAT
ncbi:MAG: glycosyl hydrolase, partial [Chloroflexota bacterium]|nr:glycosyl hydrolase [Chloroflexota bacterium]